MGDGVLYEMLKAGAPILSPLLCILFNIILDRGELPEQITRSILCHLHETSSTKKRTTIEVFRY